MEESSSRYEPLDIKEGVEPSYRLIDRDSTFKQSNGALNIRRVGAGRRAHLSDWFHTVINQATWKIIVGVIALYYMIFLVYSLGYYSVSDDCNLSIENFREAFFFSVETMMTIGYGAPLNDVYFGQCGSVLALMSTQTVLGVLVNTCCLGVIFTRLSRGQTRATSIVFSDKAIIRRIRGSMYFMFQVCEIRKHQLLEAHVRVYAVKKQTDSNGNVEYFQTQFMRLQSPDDQLGAPLLLALPSRVVHRLDAWSPLVPAPTRPWQDPPVAALIQSRSTSRRSTSRARADDYNTTATATIARMPTISSASAGSLAAVPLPEMVSPTSTSTSLLGASGGDMNSSPHSVSSGSVSHSSSYNETAATPNLLPPLHQHYTCSENLFPDLPQREIDAECGQRNSAICEVCGDGFISAAALARHHKFNIATHGPYLEAAAAAAANERSETKRRRPGLPETKEGSHLTPEAVKQHLVTSQIEIIVLVEGDDASTSATIQARHSYTTTDIVWDHTFAPCTFLRPKHGGAIVDFSRFHDLVPVAADTVASDDRAAAVAAGEGIPEHMKQEGSFPSYYQSSNYQ